MTFDKAWFDFNNQHEQILLPEEENPPTMARHIMRSPKTMFTVVWNSYGFHLVGVLSKRQKLTSQCFIDNILAERCALHDEKDQERLVVHVDNARLHCVKRVKQYLEDHDLRTAPHQADLLDFARS
jgi:hypothetical protein